jgi:hypothetical protein
MRVAAKMLDIPTIVFTTNVPQRLLPQSSSLAGVHAGLAVESTVEYEGVKRCTDWIDVVLSFVEEEKLENIPGELVSQLNFENA